MVVLDANIAHNFIGWVFTAEWKEGDDAAVYKAVDTIAERVQVLARERGLLLDFILPSFAGSSQKVMQSYGLGNLKRLQETSAKYDPKGVFQKLQNDGFLLRKI